jgi:hypothetical protein
MLLLKIFVPNTRACKEAPVLNTMVKPYVSALKVLQALDAKSHGETPRFAHKAILKLQTVVGPCPSGDLPAEP